MSKKHQKSIRRVKVSLQGTVQGVGFRPFVYRLAVELGLTGFVCNSSEGVTIEAQGPVPNVDKFLARLKTECPPHAVIQNFNSSNISVEKEERFVIRDSQTASQPLAVILPDLATCPECLGEVMDPSNRRYRYPFTNCTHCGPRYSIIEQLPYDRKNTSMKTFTMCSDCQREYDDPNDRRFHAQPNACPVCGPQLQLLNNRGEVLTKGNNALMWASGCLCAGQVVALKGLGGFQLVADACSDHAVALLRQRKHREEKPLAMMFPSLSVIKDYCVVSDEEERALLSSQAPIVLLPKRKEPRRGDPVAAAVSFENPCWGVMLPYTPLHHLLMKEFGFPVVATSANFSEEPMCIDNQDALTKLATVADVFLVHDRPVVRPVDDSVGRMVHGQLSINRRARGFAPLPVLIDAPEAEAATILSVGAQMKNAVALKVGNKVYVSQHIGDLHSPESLATFTQSIESLRGLYPQPVDYVAADLHPDYASTRYANGQGQPVIFVQHHHAHVVSCMAEHHLQGPVLGLAWDGTGLGDDQVIWGSEFLVSTASDFIRVGHLLPFRIPGGDSSIRQPKRTALGLLAMLSSGNLNDFRDLLPMQMFSVQEIVNIQKMLANGLQSPYTTSMGRLFDGVSALLGLCQQSTFEGQAAMLLEHAIGEDLHVGQYTWTLKQEEDAQGGKYILDWRPMLREIIAEIRGAEPTAQIAARFHHTLVEMAVDLAQRVGQHQIVLSGGCFQNRYLIQRLIDRLREEGFDPYWHSQVPTNDGGIALGQAVIAAARCEQTKGQAYVSSNSRKD